MSSAQDKILIIAERLGEFTTGQMAIAYKGSATPTAKMQAWALLDKMTKYGHIIKVGKVRTEANQKENVWRYIA